MSEATLDGFSAWVSVDDVKLPQYGVETRAMPEDGEIQAVSCWIISESDKEFEVGWTVPAHPEQLIAQVYVDYSLAGTRIHPLGKPSGPMTIKSMDVSDTVLEALIFPKSELIDEDAAFDLGYLGNIRVEIWVGRHLGSTPPPGTRGDAKKAISHRAIPGDEVAIAPEKVQEWTRDRRIMCFEFNYRSREEGIIPFDFSPDARPQKRPAETPEPTSEGEEETEAQLENEELRLRQEQLRVPKEEQGIENEELDIQLEIVGAKRQRKKVKLEH